MGLLAKLRSLGRFRPAQSADLPLVQPGQLRVISTRDDGLCMRINTILDAALVARAYGGTYGFHWDEAETPAIDQQTTSSALAVFEAGFLAGHRLSDGLIVDAPDLYAPPRTAEDLAARLAAGRSAGEIGRASCRERV